VRDDLNKRLRDVCVERDALKAALVHVAWHYPAPFQPMHGAIKCSICDKARALLAPVPARGDCPVCPHVWQHHHWDAALGAEVCWACWAEDDKKWRARSVCNGTVPQTQPVPARKHRHRWIWDPVRKPGLDSWLPRGFCKGCGERRMFTLWTRESARGFLAIQKTGPQWLCRPDEMKPVPASRAQPEEP
jgi:hypothetical protein